MATVIEGILPNGVDTIKMEPCGSFKGHTSAVTSLTTCVNFPLRVISTSRDKSCLIWNVALDFDGRYIGKPIKRLVGHSHFVTDLSLSVDSNFALTSSWDKTIRLWDLKTGETKQKFLGHTADVLTVNFSPDSRHIVSGGRDKVVRVWNTLGHNKFNLLDDPHTGWVSSAKISQPQPYGSATVVVTGGWDSKVKLWDLNTAKIMHNFEGHKNQVNNVAVSPDGSLCASVGKDPYVIVWDLNEFKHLLFLNLNADGEQVAFSPSRYWLAVASMAKIYIFDLEKKCLVCELPPAGIPATTSAAYPKTTSLTWSTDGNILYAGYDNGNIRVWRHYPAPPAGLSYGFLSGYGSD